MQKSSIGQAIAGAAKEGTNPAGKCYRYLSVSAITELAGLYNLPPRKIEIEALGLEIIPQRYERSIGTVGMNGQKRLLESNVGVIGAGGLGGFVLELLARMGVGSLIVVDDDVFTDSNLNRQLLATEKTLGLPKAEMAAGRIAAVNSSVEVRSYHCRGNEDNLPEIFSPCDLVIDCLDNLSSRYDLEKACHKLDIIMVHGAIGGFLGQLAVIRPDQPLLKAIYGPIEEGGSDKGVEVQLGNPAATPAMVASWQVSEAVKILVGLEGILPSDEMLIIDMQSGETYRIKVEG